MTFFRSQEVQRLCVLLGLTTAVAAAAGFCRDVWTGLAALGGSLAVAAVALLFTAWRYREMEKLAANLRRIAGGDYSLDVRDNEEGELSILKSELYKVTAMLSEYNERLRQEKVSLSDSMADISHQLKTPLTSMLMMADLLQDSELPEEKRREFTGRLRAQLERIEWLVSSLLKLSKLDAGVAVMKKDPVNVRSLVEKAVSPLLIPMELKEQTLELEGGEGVYFIGDAHWTTEALINILKKLHGAHPLRWPAAGHLGGQPHLYPDPHRRYRRGHPQRGSAPHLHPVLPWPERPRRQRGHRLGHGEKHYSPAKRGHHGGQLSQAGDHLFHPLL